MKCQYCGEQKGVKKVNYMNKEKPQYAMMCLDCAKEFESEELKMTSDKQLAKQCLNFKGFYCDNKDCKNKECPLNKDLEGEDEM